MGSTIRKRPAGTAARGLPPKRPTAGDFEVAGPLWDAKGFEAETGSKEASRHRQIYEASLDAIIVFDSEGVIADFNPAAERIFGFSREEVVGRDLGEVLLPAGARDQYRLNLKALEAGDCSSERHRALAKRADGSELTIEHTIVPIEDPKAGFCAFVRDVTEEVRRDHELESLASDNEQILNAAGDGIYRVDVDGRITFANPAAGAILGMEQSDLIGQHAHTLLHHSYEDGRPYPVEDCPIAASRHQGTVVHTTEEVFWRADGTCFPVDYTSAPVRDNGQIIGAVCVFADIAEQQRVERGLRDQTEWTKRIQVALRSDCFVLHAQPIVAPGSGRTVMHEVLVRMRGPDGQSLFSPAEFLPQAERFHLMDAIDCWVIEASIPLAARARLAINLSAQTLTEPRFAEWIIGELEACGTPPQNLVFEITETAAFSNIEVAMSNCTELANAGCAIALDDFGTGYGSFTELKRLPLSYVKIDREFVKDLARNDGDRGIIEAIVSVSEKFGLVTVGEGIEDEETWTALRDLGVDLAQGYRFGAPAPIEEMEDS